MKFSVSSAELLKHLQMAAGSISSNPVLPILEDFLFAIDGNTLKISATDLETSLSTEIEIMAADKNGTVAVPAKILLDTLKALPQQPITFSVDDEHFGIEITSAFGKYKLAGENGQDYPNIPQPEDVDTVSIPGQALDQAISKTIFATSNDELRPAMTGVYFQVEFNKLMLVATDAHKLVKYTYKELNSEVSTAFIVPKKALNLLKGLPSGETVKMSFNKANAFFSYGNTQLSCRLIDARYPDYNAVIPVDNPNLLTISRTDFQNSLKRIAIYANKTTNQVILNINDGSLTISAQDLDFSNEATEQLSCSYSGDALTIGFNAKFLIEMLNVLESDEVVMELSTSTRAGILLPSEKEEEEDILMLVMPVMLSN